MLSAQEPKKYIVEKENDKYIYQCPHCELFVITYENELNCKIFRHGVLKTNNTQISPHCPKQQCDDYVTNDLIFGCGKPYKFIECQQEASYVVECDYI
jgi:hypothetical protein